MAGTGLAAVVHRFGPPEVIQIEPIAVADPGPGEVLLRVHAAGVGPWDAWVRAGKSAVPQLLPLVLGADLAGAVEAVGPGVDEPRVGQTVFGATNARFTGAYAELALADAGRLAARPVSLTSIEAAAVPVVASTGLQMLELATVRRGSRVLVLGAAGNVGRWATRLALRAGAEVTGVVLDVEAEHARRLGALDLRTSLPAAGTFDVVLDSVGGRLARACVPLLGPGGVLVSSVEPIGSAELGRPDVVTRFFLVEVTAKRLAQLARLVDGGGFPVVVGDVLPLTSAVRAHRMLEGTEPRAAGKTILRVAE